MSLSIQIVRGSRWKSAIAITVTEQPAGTSYAPNITADSVVLTIDTSPTPTTFTADVATSGADGIALFDLSSAETTAIDVGIYNYDIVWHKSDSSQETLHGGSLTVAARAATGLALEIMQYDKWVFDVPITVTEQPSGISFAPDISADSVVLTINTYPSPTTFLADVTTSGASGVAIFTLETADTGAIPAGIYDCEIVWSLEGGDQEALQGGSITITPRVA